MNEEFWRKWRNMSVDERIQAIKEYARKTGLYIDEWALGDCWIWHAPSWEQAVLVANWKKWCKTCMIRTKENEGRCPVLEYLNIPFV